MVSSAHEDKGPSATFYVKNLLSCNTVVRVTVCMDVEVAHCRKASIFSTFSDLEHKFPLLLLNESN